MTNLEVEPNPDLTDVEGDLQEEMGITNIMSEIRMEQIREEILAPIREALSNHPRCDVHPEDDPANISFGSFDVWQIVTIHPEVHYI